MRIRRKLFALLLTAALAAALCAPALAGETPTLANFSAGSAHGLAVDATGSLWAWGDNNWGQLGDPKLGNGKAPYGGLFQTYPVKIMEGVASASGGGSGSLAVKADGTLWLWGSFGGKSGGKAPWKLMDGVASAALDKWADNGGAVKTDGTLWLWGDNSLGQLAPAGVAGERSDTPVQVMKDVASVSLAFGRVMALKTDGTLWTWGQDSFGKLGTGEVGDVPNGGFPYNAKPTQVLDKVAKVAAGCNSSLAVKTDGTLWAWGAAEPDPLTGAPIHNAMDMYKQPYQNVPVQIMEGVADAASGHGTSYLLKTDGTLWSGGGNGFGEAGSGTAEEGIGFVQILSGVAAVDAGDCFALAEKTDGTLWGWGINAAGQLGVRGGNSTSVLGPQHTLPVPLTFGQTPPAHPASAIPVYPGVNRLLVDGSIIDFPIYARYNAKGNATSYVRLRDVAYVMAGKACQFSVEYDGVKKSIALTTGGVYQRDSSELLRHFTGDQWAVPSTSALIVNGVDVKLEAITLTDAHGGGYNYFKLRDLGRALDFDVTWDGETNQIVVESGKSYTED